MAALLGIAAYALAEELTLTTYYPSPRGVYSELRVMNNVGIGTTSPQKMLHIAGTSSTARITLEEQFGETAQLGMAGAPGDGRLGIFDDLGNEVLSILTKDDQWRGNVGIGTTAPGAKLEIADGAYPNGMGRIRLNGATYDAPINLFVIVATGTQEGKAACQSQGHPSAVCLAYLEQPDRRARSL